MTTLQQTFTWTITASVPCLIEPLRAAVERAAADARAFLDGMGDECKGTMAWDSCEDAIDHRNLCWLYSSRKDVIDNLWDAEGQREGYDTWSRADLRRHIAALKQLRDALTTLIDEIKHLERREAEEINQLLGRAA